MDRETVITHLQIIHTWASFSSEHDLHFITTKHLEDIAQWANDALNLLKEYEAKEQEEKEKHPCERCQELACDGCPYADD